MHNPTLDEDVKRILARMDNTGSEEPNDTKPLTERQEPEEYDVYIEPDRITVVKRPEPQVQVIEAVKPPQPQPYFAYVAVTLSSLLLSYLVIAACITVFFPPVVTVTIIPESHVLTLTGTVQLGRLLRPITLSQSQTVLTTGKGHQDARSAIGYITFYNGLFSSQTIAAGTIVTGADGVHIITDQEAGIPAANPPSLGYATVSAHAITQGTAGNIPSYDINEACCSTAIKAVNTTPFHGGQNERTFQTVAKADIASIAIPLKTTVAQSMQGAVTAQVNQHETLLVLPCSRAETADHNAGDEAKEVTVTVSQTCSAAAYNSQALEERVKSRLASLAATKLGPGYRLRGDVQVSVKKAIVTRTTTPLVFLTFQAQGTWVYGLNAAGQQAIKSLIAGKPKQEALRELLALPGIAHASIRVTGIGDAARLPENIHNIHLVLYIL
jgi:hypothetical protein